MRDNWLSNRIFSSYDDIVDHCCFAWNKLVDQPWRIMSIGLRQWAHGLSSLRLGITEVKGGADTTGSSAYCTAHPRAKICALRGLCGAGTGCGEAGVKRPQRPILV
jgi:hypothetical protein